MLLASPTTGGARRPPRESASVALSTAFQTRMANTPSFTPVEMTGKANDWRRSKYQLACGGGLPWCPIRTPFQKSSYASSTGGMRIASFGLERDEGGMSRWRRYQANPVDEGWVWAPQVLSVGRCSQF